MMLWSRVLCMGLVMLMFHMLVMRLMMLVFNVLMMRFVMRMGLFTTLFCIFFIHMYTPYEYNIVY
jgi:hypothetical protein